MHWLALVGLMVPGWTGAAAEQETGSVRGTITDSDFGGPVTGVEVRVVKTGESTTTDAQGSYFIDAPSGEQQLVFRKDGYIQAVRTVFVEAGSLTKIDQSLKGDFTEMDDLVVQDALQLSAGTELALLQLRFDSPSLEDSIGSELMSRAGVSDAAGAVRLIAGASLKDGKSAVIRGLPDRYVSSQVNGMRLPTADEDKRAVELDQFPSAVIENIRIKKTFTPDQQGDASGGAVDVRLRGVPTENFLEVRTQYSANSQVTGRTDFLTYRGGGVNTFGKDDGGRDIQFDRIAESETDPVTGANLGSNWDGAVGVKRGKAPDGNGKLSLALGGRKEFSGFTVGGFGSVFYERDSSFYDNGVDDSYWVTNPGEPLTPETSQGTPGDGDFRTALFDVTKGTESVQWGTLLTAGIESELHTLSATFLHSRTTDDTATLATDTRSKAFYFPGYDRDDPEAVGNESDNLTAAPYLRTETLEYTERTTGTLQFQATHVIPTGDFSVGDLLTFQSPEIDWTYAVSDAELNQPDKRQFGALWLPPSLNPGAPPFILPFESDPTWVGFKPSANFTLGNFQRIWKSIEEESDQYTLNLTLPFVQWSDTGGSFKVGLFDDEVERTFDQDTYSNFNDNSTSIGDWDDPWSEDFPFEDHPITNSLFDIDYDGDLRVAAYYGMLDLPITSFLTVVGGARVERTEIGIVNRPEEFATWFPKDALGPVELLPGEADVQVREKDLLPSIALIATPHPTLTVRASWSETLARQTFKELSPILQQEFLGGPIFIGNPDLRTSALENLDFRVDYRPAEGWLFSASRFEKEIDRPIEYVQRFVDFNFTTPVNYPEGKLSGYEFEVRQNLGTLWGPLSGFSIGGNATLIDSEVTLPKDEVDAFADPGIDVDLRTREMTSAPEHLYNLYVTYDILQSGTQFSLFYTVQGDTLVSGAGIATGNFVPSIYAKEFDTLNFVAAQRLGNHFALKFQAKNLTNAKIERVYRSDVTGPDVTRSSFTTGIDFSVGLSANFRF